MQGARATAVPPRFLSKNPQNTQTRPRSELENPDPNEVRPDEFQNDSGRVGRPTD